MRITRLAIHLLMTTLVGTTVLVATATPASAAVYALGTLCSADDNRVNITPYRSWSIPQVHATSDFTNNSNGYSFRTCSWRGTNHVYRYRCNAEYTNGWLLNIVAAEHTAQRRVQYPVTCDGVTRSVPWNLSHSTHEIVHYHLWAPSGPGCAESCGFVLGGWYASLG